MAKHINNMDELEKVLQPIMQKMVAGMANRVYEILNFFLQRYYDSYDPIYYRRQYDFLRSGFKVDARIVRGKAVASVYIDVDYMSNYYGVTGQQIAIWANEGLHGGKNLASNTPHVWDVLDGKYCRQWSISERCSCLFEKSRIYSQSIGKTFLEHFSYIINTL